MRSLSTRRSVPARIPITSFVYPIAMFKRRTQPRQPLRIQQPVTVRIPVTSPTDFAK